jgi:NAD(P)-dependent dehydrogenase (short-subunit alcohol dehydrogenase family)
MDELFSLKGKNVLIVGASSGIGEHAAKVFSARGADLFLSARRKDRLDEMALKLNATSYYVDVQDVNSINEMLSKIDRIDVLLITAGMNVRKPALKHTADDWDALMNVNLKGIWSMTQAVIDHMVSHETQGSIINMSSIYGSITHPDYLIYSTSKAGVEQMTKSFALECAAYGIRVNAIAPGYIETDLNREFLQQVIGEYAVKRTPLKRLGSLSDLDGVLLLLATQASAYMTGNVVPVDGGISVHQL